MTTVERFTPVRRQGYRVMPLELFFDLVFVLAVTQCTGFMGRDPTWAGVGEGLLLLGILWWSWVGYAWLTSVVDPEEGAVRLVLVAAMAGVLVAALAIPDAFGDLGLTFAIAYGCVRASHIALFTLASRDEPDFRSSVVGLGVGTAIGVGLLIGGAMFDSEGTRVAFWSIALLLDMAEPYFFGADGWRLEPTHFVERHGLVIIVALGESVVAIGVGASHGVDARVIVAAVAAMTMIAGLWWTYFDVVSTVAARRLIAATEGRERNELARDAYSYLHFPLIAGIVLAAFGLEATIAHVDESLEVVPAVALGGGTALYLLGHVAFARRSFGALKVHRVLAALAALVVIPIGTEVDAVVTVVLVAAILSALVTYETFRYAEARQQIRHEVS